MMTYKCEGCEETYTGSAEDAFNLGWDTPERFMSHCTCPNCPIDKTVWWKVVVNKEQITEAQARLIQSYNQIYSEANEVSLKSVSDN